MSPRKSLSLPDGVSPEDVRNQLERILAAELFARSTRLSDFLRFVVEKGLASELEQVKEMTLALEVFERPSDFEAKLDPFLPLALAAEHTTTLRLGTALAIGFGRTPMTLAEAAYGLQSISGGRFVLGLGSQVRPHIEKRFSMPWSKPAARMREMVQAIKAIFACWESGAELDFRGEFYTHTIMIPAFDPGPNPFGPPPIFTAYFCAMRRPGNVLRVSMIFAPVPATAST